MNPFNNNRPNLSASDRLRDKKSAYIYSATKKKFQMARKTCRSKNIKFYKKGSVRSVPSYKIQQNLARGNVLCEDCDNKGLSCRPIASNIFSKIDSGNNFFSEFSGGGRVSMNNFLDGPFQTVGFPVIQSDVSGTWDSSANDFKGDISLCGPSGTLICPFGYIDNIIKIPKNLNGSGITIDPSNMLFRSDSCGLQFKSILPANKRLRTNMVIRGNFAIHEGDALENILLLNGSTCTDPSYNLLVGKYAWIPFGVTSTPGIIGYGVITSICCVGTSNSVVQGSDPCAGSGAPPIIPDPLQNLGIFDITITFTEIFDLDKLYKLASIKPIWKTYTTNPADAAPCFAPGWFWPNVDFEIGADGMDDLWYLWIWLPELAAAGFGGKLSLTISRTISSVTIYQGTCQTNQTIGNNTKQSYMSCLDNKINNIKFT